MRTVPRLRKIICCICDWGNPAKRKYSKLIDYMKVFTKKLAYVAITRAFREGTSFRNTESLPDS